MAGSLFGRLSLEEGDSANSLEGLDIKLGGEGKNMGPYLLVRGGGRGLRTDRVPLGLGIDIVARG